MQAANCLLDFGEQILAGLDRANPLLRSLDLALPAVGAFDRSGDLDTGGEFFRNQRDGDPLGVSLIGNGRGDLNDDRRQ